jgi:peptide/nickel transport system substrate-binding protein
MNMLDRTSKLRMRRIVRRRQKQVEAATQAAEKQFDRNLIGRFDRLLHVRRFTLGWIALILLITFCTVLQTLALSGYYQKVLPAPGGIYNEGVVGSYSNANPLFAVGSVDTAVSRLLFSGLLTYDSNNRLVGDLANSFSVDQTGKHYEVKLKPNLKWHDGQALTADDVVFTYHLIQNPDVQSPLLTSWQNITVKAVNPTTVSFDLPNVYSAFPYNLVTGIVPEHLLKDTPAAQVRSTSFNTTKPVGAGPFAWQAIQTSGSADPERALTLIALKPFKEYARGAPKLSGYTIHAYGNKERLIEAFKKRDVNAMTGLDSVPKELSKTSDVIATSFSSTAAVMSFFKTSSGVLADAQVRQALIQGSDVGEIIRSLGYPTKSVNEPLLMGQVGYDAKYAQARYNLTNANQILDKAGWVRGSDGIRKKNGQRLAFRLYAEETTENRRTANQLVSDWKALGADVTPVLQQLTDFQTTLEIRNYDALLYGISIGADPDVYPYWHSTQADLLSANRLNFSEYKSATADASLEAGRTRLSPELRALKYKPFLQAWQTDAPALGLYQPRFLYITRGNVYNLPSEQPLNVDADRYSSVSKWEIHTQRVTNN